MTPAMAQNLIKSKTNQYKALVQKAALAKKLGQTIKYKVASQAAKKVSAEIKSLRNYLAHVQGAAQVQPITQVKRNGLLAKSAFRTLAKTQATPDYSSFIPYSSRSFSSRLNLWYKWYLSHPSKHQYISVVNGQASYQPFMASEPVRFQAYTSSETFEPSTVPLVSEAPATLAVDEADLIQSEQSDFPVEEFVEDDLLLEDDAGFDIMAFIEQNKLAVGVGAAVAIYMLFLKDKRRSNPLKKLFKLNKRKVRKNKKRRGYNRNRRRSGYKRNRR